MENYQPAVKKGEMLNGKVFNSLKELIRETTVEEIFPARVGAILDAKDKDKASVAFKKLAENRILSVPLLKPGKKGYFGFFDVLDVLHYLAANVDAGELNKAENLSSLLDKLDCTCEQVSDSSGRDPFRPMDETAKVLRLLDTMTSRKLHRIAVIDGAGHLTTIVSASQVLAFLKENTTLIDDKLLESKIGDIKLGYCDVVCSGLEDKPLQAFMTMRNSNVSAVAVVNEDGTIAGNISASDLRSTESPEFMNRLFSTNKEFILHTQNQNNPNEGERKIRGPICVRENTTFEEAISKLVTEKVHRLYIINDQGKPIGVITAQEIIKHLLGNI